MKSSIHLLIIVILTFCLAGCGSRGNEPVSANSDNVAEQTNAPGKVSEPEPTAPARKNMVPSKTRPAEPRQDAPYENLATRNPIPEDRPEAAPRAPAMETIPSGTAVTVVLNQGIGTDNNQEGDTFTADLAETLTINGKVLADKGALVAGRVRTIEEPGKVKGRARMELELTELRVGGRSYNLDTEPFIAVAPDNKDRDAAIIAGGAGAGAIIGAATKGKKGAAIGAIIGGGSGTTAVLMTRGKDIHLDPEAKVNFVLKDSVRLPAVRPAS